MAFYFYISRNNPPRRVKKVTTQSFDCPSSSPPARLQTTPNICCCSFSIGVYQYFFADLLVPDLKGKMISNFHIQIEMTRCQAYANHQWQAYFFYNHPIRGGKRVGNFLSQVSRRKYFVIQGKLELFLIKKFSSPCCARVFFFFFPFPCQHSRLSQRRRRRPSWGQSIQEKINFFNCFPSQ